jgi:hypothetical protein
MAFDDSEIRMLRETPPETIVANHAFNLLQLATIHLASKPPNLEEADLVIMAVAGLLDAVHGYLGEGEALLREALTEIRVVQVRAHAQGKG